MSDLKLYRIEDEIAVALTSSASALERHLQKVIETNMEVLFGVRLLASEFSTGPVHGGRMDSIGLDEDGSPVIFEYKRSVGETVINQGLFYLDWLLDHQGDFRVLVIEKFGAEVAASIDFSNPRLVCVANSFTKYDEHAIRQMGRAIELVRYQHFDGALLALELFATTTSGSSAAKPQAPSPTTQKSGGPTKYKTVTESIESAPQGLRDLYDELRLTIEALGDDITVKTTKYYVNFRRLKSFASVEVYTQARKLQVFVKLDPADVELETARFSRDVTSIGHLGNGNVELTVTDATTLAKAMALVQRSYEAN